MGSLRSPREAALRHAPPARPGKGERQALAYLEGEILPELKRQHRDDLVRDLRRCVAGGSLDPLGGLSAPQKHALLGTLEGKMARRAPHRPGPSVVVRLVGCLDLSPPELLGLERRRAILPPR